MAVVLNRGAAEPLVAPKSSRVPPIYEHDVYLLANCGYGCRQYVLKRRKGAANQKRLRNTALLQSKLSQFFARDFLQLKFKGLLSQTGG